MKGFELAVGIGLTDLNGRRSLPLQTDTDRDRAGQSGHPVRAMSIFFADDNYRNDSNLSKGPVLIRPGKGRTGKRLELEAGMGGKP